MEDLLEVLFEYKGSKREIIVESSHLCKDVANELETKHGISQPTVSLSAAAATSSSQSRAGNIAERYFLQKWCSKWKEYVDVERASDVKEGDKLTVVKIRTNPIEMDSADAEPALRTSPSVTVSNYI